MDEHAVVATRRSLHAVAERLLAGPQDRAHGEIRLQVTPVASGSSPGRCGCRSAGSTRWWAPSVAQLPGRSRAPAGDGYGALVGDPRAVHTPAGVLDHFQDADETQEHPVDLGEADCEDRVGPRGQELSPGRSGPLRCAVDARGPSRVLQKVEVATRFSSSGRVGHPHHVYTPGYPHYQRPHRLRDWGTAQWSCVNPRHAGGDALIGDRLSG